MNPDCATAPSTQPRWEQTREFLSQRSDSFRILSSRDKAIHAKSTAAALRNDRRGSIDENSNLANELEDGEIQEGTGTIHTPTASLSEPQGQRQQHGKPGSPARPMLSKFRIYEDTPSPTVGEDALSDDIQLDVEMQKLDL